MFTQLHDYQYAQLLRPAQYWIVPATGDELRSLATGYRNRVRRLHGNARRS